MHSPISRSFRSARRGFTLIEILTVVLILGILAALIVPNMTGFMSDATTSAARSQLAAVRGQIEMYKLRHGGVVPDVAGADGTDLLFAAMIAPDDGQQPLLAAEPRLPMGYTWNWDGTLLTVAYVGPDETIVAEAPTW
jgi:general secretion pathway protein G